MATSLDYKRLREDVGANETALTDDDAETIFVEAGEEYTGVVTIKAQARVIAIQRLLASSAKLTDYAQDTTQEKLGQVFDHLTKLLAFWQDKLAAAIKDEKLLAGRTSGARFGGLRRKPSRVQEWPDA